MDENSLLKRDFVKVNESSGGTRIRIMQWNILAQALCYGDENFVLCPKEVMNWDRRKSEVLKEMTRFNPTILCLEEVDKFSYFCEKLKMFGYEGSFFPKPYSPCLSFPGNSGPDGCAMFYKVDQVEMLEKNNIILTDDEGFETNQVSIICKFRVKGHANGPGAEDGSIFFVAVTHLKAKKGYEEMRLVQGQSLLNTLEMNTVGLPLIICGDFNAPPEEKIHSAFKKSTLGLSSAYTELSEEKKEPAYTTWKIRGSKGRMSESCETIDYIWYTSKNIQVESVLSIPKEEEIGKNRLPSANYPSDHISLACDFIL